MISAPLRAGTPNGPAAAPDRNETTPILIGASWAAANAGTSAATAAAAIALFMTCMDSSSLMAGRWCSKTAPTVKGRAVIVGRLDRPFKSARRATIIALRIPQR